jgi:5'-nucleotidase
MVEATELLDLKDLMRKYPLRIGISTRSLFDLEKEDRVFKEKGVHAYIELQHEQESELIKKGSGFELVKRLLNLNEQDLDPFVQVIVLSKNSPDLSIRAFRSIEEYGLPILQGSFTSGRSLAPYVKSWDLDLFLSNDSSDVKAVYDAGVASAHLGEVPVLATEMEDEEVRIAFDGDSVIFSPESDLVYKSSGLAAFREHEIAKSHEPMSGGPLGQFLKKLSILRKIFLEPNNISKVRIGLVTARDRIAHERVINTLRAWDTPVDEAHFVGRWKKSPILNAFRAHIFFDDQRQHVLDAAPTVPSAKVPGPHDGSPVLLPAGG